MNKLTKILALGTTAALMALSLAGCGGSSNSGSSSSSSATSTTESAANLNLIKSGKLVMGTNAEFPPFESMEGGEVVGVDASIMKEVASRLGLELEIQNMEFDSLPSALSGKSIDCIAAGYTVTADRQASMEFTDSYYTAKQTVIVNAGSAVKSKDDLTGKKIGAQSGTTGFLDAEDITDKDKVIAYNNGSLAVEALLNNQVDAVIIDNNPAKEYKSQQGDKVTLLQDQFEAEDYAVAVSKGNTDLQKAINGALNDMESDGTLKSIIDQFIK